MEQLVDVLSSHGERCGAEFPQGLFSAEFAATERDDLTRHHAVSENFCKRSTLAAVMKLGGCAKVQGL